MIQWLFVRSNTKLWGGYDGHKEATNGGSNIWLFFLEKWQWVIKSSAVPATIIDWWWCWCVLLPFPLLLVYHNGFLWTPFARVDLFGLFICYHDVQTHPAFFPFSGPTWVFLPCFSLFLHKFSYSTSCVPCRGLFHQKSFMSCFSLFLRKIAYKLHPLGPKNI